MERRWSVVGAPWSRKKNAASSNGSSSRLSRLDDIFGSRKSMSVTSATASAGAVDTPPRSVRLRADSMDSGTTNAYLDNMCINDDSNAMLAPESDFMRISKSEYEAIKERVQAIETRISQEFTAVVNASARQQQYQEENDSTSMDTSIATATFAGNGPAAVLSKYERTLEQNSSDAAASAATDQLAKRLSRELKIRRSDHGSSAGGSGSSSNTVIRSPSARKIGTMRRRSRETAVRLSRNFSWHLGGGSASASVETAQQQLRQQQQQPHPRRVATTMPQSSEELNAAAAAVATATAMAAQQQQQLQAQQLNQTQQQQRANLKRGRPNTVQTGLRVPSPTKKPTILSSVAIEADVLGVEEQSWTNGEQFFADMGTPQSQQKHQQLPQQQSQTPKETAAILQPSLKENQPSTPYFVSTAALNEMKTPMLPPRRPLNFRTPLTLQNSVKVCMVFLLLYLV